MPTIEISISGPAYETYSRIYLRETPILRFSFHCSIICFLFRTWLPLNSYFCCFALSPLCLRLFTLLMHFWLLAILRLISFCWNCILLSLSSSLRVLVRLTWLVGTPVFWTGLCDCRSLLWACGEFPYFWGLSFAGWKVVVPTRIGSVGFGSCPFLYYSKFSSENGKNYYKVEIHFETMGVVKNQENKNRFK